MPFATDSANFLVEIFSEKSNTDDSSISLPVFPAKPVMEQHHIPLTPKTVMRIKTNLDYFKLSCIEDIPTIVLKNYESELSYFQCDVFQEILFSRLLGKSHLWSHQQSMLGEIYHLKTITLLVLIKKDL